MQDRLRAALLITGGFMFLEAAAGWWTGSLALLSDAGHMLTDTASLAAALWISGVAARPPDADHPQGHGRAEVLGAAATSGGLAVLALWLAATAVGRLSAPPEVAPGGVIAVAAAGLLLNLAMAALLMRGEGLLHRAALLNVLADALGSLGALTAGALIAWKGWHIADPLASLLISALILTGAGSGLRDAGRVLMHAPPPDLDLDALRRDLDATPGVASLHDLHAWTLRPGEEVLSVHIVLSDPAAAVPVCRSVEEAARRHLPRAHITVQPEAPDQPRNPKA